MDEKTSKFVKKGVKLKKAKKSLIITLKIINFGAAENNNVTLNKTPS
jgi:hypothetical protein